MRLDFTGLHVTSLGGSPEGARYPVWMNGVLAGAVVIDSAQRTEGFGYMISGYCEVDGTPEECGDAMGTWLEEVCGIDRETIRAYPAGPAKLTGPGVTVTEGPEFVAVRIVDDEYKPL